jgi:molybdenum cofactor biosynthesis enzyme MoaA
MLAKSHLYFNITYRCDSACLFCAADLGPNATARQITFKEFASLVNKFPRGSRTRVTINGGEPALHHELVKFLRFLKRRQNQTALFTNGRKLSSPSFAKLIGDNLRGTILIPLYGSRPEIHDTFTGVKGSWAQTVRGISNIYELKARHRQLRLHLKLLFIKPLLKENVETIKYILRTFPKVDIISLHSLIVSEKVKHHPDLIPSRGELARSVNRVLAVLRRRAPQTEARQIDLSDLPPCVINRQSRPFLIRAGDCSVDNWAAYYFDPGHLTLSGAKAEEELHSSQENNYWCICQNCRQKNHCLYLGME